MQNRSRQRRRAPADARAFWSTADARQIERALRASSRGPDADAARALRDRVAANVLADPALAVRLARALLRSTHRATPAPSAQVRAIAWRAHAEASVFSGRLKTARQAYERACDLAQQARDRSLLAQMLVGRVHLLSLLGEATEAARHGRRAERLLRQSGDLIYLGKLYMNRGNAHYQGDRYAEAHAAYGKAARVFERAGVQDATWASLLMNQGIACTHLSRVREARGFFLQTEAAAEELGLDALAAQARFNRAFLERLRGDYRLALRLLEAASAVFSAHGARDMLAAAERERAETYLD
ncbi:MAG: hypothetical protein GF330_11830, partial [Candidatus Eisenbacteria bacterium]|nr:hypothetical protein [Candidatus Eisenbacteria bacterium]